jgi:hypothetical protein
MESNIYVWFHFFVETGRIRLYNIAKITPLPIGYVKMLITSTVFRTVGRDFFQSRRPNRNSYTFIQVLYIR